MKHMSLPCQRIDLVLKGSDERSGSGANFVLVILLELFHAINEGFAANVGLILAGRDLDSDLSFKKTR